MLIDFRQRQQEMFGINRLLSHLWRKVKLLKLLADPIFIRLEIVKIPDLEVYAQRAQESLQRVELRGVI